ncbi:UDP-glucose dehydrogenase family protein [Papillibacter cinnamivorans]|uniref:UDP-glucose 6-dehydrogenase n=1 Tax=Papillibacter cinnamivorans DSM 12816 TaxID=1122930 RepID=A0A1W1YNL9_9FIRM|nr:UDP-glucose/GDP-mannose dehydrogenase family protein [Papillibacter cinnamivorans]SMC37726.1 UDPglucose 6-dehydrogenase [Papillibacter cinnamivorans DSM 12816]
MKIAVVGTGYVGLVTAVCLAHTGHEVRCLDRDETKISLLRRGVPPIFEAGVRELMEENKNSLIYTADPGEAIPGAEVIFICVGTPERADGYANLAAIYESAEEIAEHADRDCVVVVKSTVPMGTNEKLEKLLSSRIRRGIRLEVASNPEFLSQGTAVRDMLSGQRLVLGVESETAEAVLRRVYREFDVPILVSDRKTAEMIKYASNNFLALKISYINEIANLCEAVGADVETVALGMGMDERIGNRFLRSGVGYGGSCFPKDTKALHWLARYHDFELKTVKAAIEVNENQKIRLIKKARRYYPCLEGLNAAVLGLSFKPGTDDLRDAPSLQHVAVLLDNGVHVRVWDPAAMEGFRRLFTGSVRYCSSIGEALKDTDICFILTEWEEVRAFPLVMFPRLMKRPVVLDGRNCFDPGAAREAGIVYDSIGRRPVLGDVAQQ